MSDCGGEELVDEGTIKKMKTKVLSNISEGVSDVVISTSVDKSSRKEKRKKDIISKIDVNTQEGDNRKEGRIRKGKTGDREGTKKKMKEKRKDAEFDDRVGNAGSVVNQIDHEVTEVFELMEDKKRNKKKDKMDLEAIGGGEDSGSRGHKRKDKSVRTKLKGEVNAVASETESIPFVNEKKRKRKKRDDSGADKESKKKIHVASSSDKSRDRGSMKNKEESLRLDAERDANPGILKHSERNEIAENSENSHRNKKSKKVKFSENLEVISHPDISSKGKKKLKNDSTEEKNVKDSSEKKEIGDDGLIRGKRFSKEEDDIIQNAVFKYIEDHQLGEEGLEMVLHCKSHPEVKHCWKEIGEALPWRPYVAVYTRAHILFERSDLRKWTQEEIELLKKFHEKHGPDWKTLGAELGKHRFHVKDAWRRYKFPNMKKGNWSQEEYEKLFSLVNMDLSMKAYTEKKLKHGMLRDNICWGTISDELATRTNSICCRKWYDQLTSPMVVDGKWANGDDYRLLIALNELDAACVEDVNWDDLLEHRSGDLCRKRWNQMVRHIGENGMKQFNEQVEILSQRYCPDLLDAREDYDNRPAVD
ncbi:Cyclin-D-binding Myb-like transcription factor 1 [Bienertia sinuspersici]